MKWEKTRRLLRFLYLKVMRQQGKPETVAGGVALGVLIGFITPPGIQTVMAIALAPLLRCNPVAAACAVWVSNPLTMPIIYPMGLSIGAWVTGLPIVHSVPTDDERIWIFITDFRRYGRTIIMLLTGLSFMGAIASVISYYTSKLLVIQYRHRRQEYRLKRMRQRLAKEARDASVQEAATASSPVGDKSSIHGD